MENKYNNEINLTFENADELRIFGEEKLFDSLSSVVSGIDDKYTIRICGLCKILYDLFGFNDYKEMKEKLYAKPIKEIIPFLKTLSHNIFVSLEDSRSFISTCLYDWGYTMGYQYRNLNIKFGVRTMLVNGLEDCSIREMEFRIMSYQKDAGCTGSGQSFSIDLVDDTKVNQIIEETKKLKLPTAVEKKFIEYFEEQTETHLTIEDATKSLNEEIINVIDNSIYSIEEDLKSGIDLKESILKEHIITTINNNEYTKDIADLIEFEFVSKDKLNIKFLDEIIKTISKSSYVVYNLNF